MEPPADGLEIVLYMPCVVGQYRTLLDCRRESYMAYKKLTASKIAQQMKVPVKEIFQTLLENCYVERKDNTWILTPEGVKAGGETIQSKQHGSFIVWPPDIFEEKEEDGTTADGNTKLLTSTQVGKHFGLSPTRINRLLNEIGWIDKGVKGWKLTDQGKKEGGHQRQHHRSGVPYVVWPQEILQHNALKQRVAEDKGDTEQVASEEKPKSFRERFPATHRTADGHLVRSRAEMLIDNWLYMNEVVHAYERKLPVEEDVYSDFYIPTGKVYVEFWGMENEPKYVERKKQKIAIYEKYNMKLIQLRDKDITNLDDVMPRELLRFDIQTF